MQIVIKIPKEFEEHYALDRFEDSLQRLRRDVHKAMIGNIGVLSDKYEIKVLDMLTEAFLNSTPFPKGHGRLIDADDAKREWANVIDCEIEHPKYQCTIRDVLEDALTIIPADKEEQQ